MFHVFSCIDVLSNRALINMLTTCCALAIMTSWLYTIPHNYLTVIGLITDKSITEAN